MTQVIGEALWHSWFDFSHDAYDAQYASPGVLLLEGKTLVDAALDYIMERSWHDKKDATVVRRAMRELTVAGLISKEAPGRWLVSLERPLTKSSK